MACRECQKKRLMNGVDITMSRVSSVIRENKDLIRGNNPVQIMVKASKVVLVYEDECFSATLSSRGWRAGAANTLFARGQKVSDQQAARMVEKLFERARSELREHVQV